jgi:type II secretory pathway pseudopilin PulG
MGQVMTRYTHIKSKHANDLQLPKQASRGGAFSLIELLVVMAIMMILATLLIGLSGYIWRASKEAKAKAGVEKIHKALLEYSLAVGGYPANTTPNKEDDLAVVMSPPLIAPFNTLTNWLEGWNQKGTNVVVDPFGHGYRYLRQSPQSYILYSCGFNGKTAADNVLPSDKFELDDIVSGK